jgi:hypothetical protein
MSNQAIEEFSKKEKERLDAERAEQIKKKGGFPYLKSLKVGETLLYLHPVIPTNNEYQGRVRKQFIVSKCGIDQKPLDEKLAWTVNPQSPTYRDLLDILPKTPINIRVIRTGQGKSDTRYTIVPAP